MDTKPKRLSDTSSGNGAVSIIWLRLVKQVAGSAAGCLGDFLQHFQCYFPFRLPYLKPYLSHPLVCRVRKRA